MNDEALKAKAIKLAQAVALHESGGEINNPNILGDFRLPNGQKVMSGTKGSAPFSLGIGQWTHQVNGRAVPLEQGQIPNVWQEQAKRILGDANAPMTLENQKAVLEGEMFRRLKKFGGDADKAIASWNIGENASQRLSNLKADKTAMDYLAKVHEQYTTNVPKLTNNIQTSQAAVTPTETPKESVGFVQDVARSIANPFLQTVSSVKDIGRTLTGEDVSQAPEYDYGYLGKAKRLGAEFDATEGITAKNISELRKAGAAGADIALTAAAPAGGAITGFSKGALLNAAKQGGMYSLAQGAADTLRGDNDSGFVTKTLGNAAINVPLNVGAAALGKGGQVLAERLGRSNVANKATQKISQVAQEMPELGIKPIPQAEDLAQANMLRRQGVASNEDLLAKDASKLRSFAMEQGKQNLNIEARNKAEALSDDIFKDILTAGKTQAVDGKVDARDVVNNLDKRLKDMSPQLDGTIKQVKQYVKNVDTLDFTTYLAKNIDELLPPNLGRAKKQSIVDAIAKNMFFYDKRGKISFDSLDEIRRVGNGLSLGDAVGDQAEIAMSRAVRGYIDDVLEKRLRVQGDDMALQALNDYKTVLKTYGDTKDALWVAENMIHKTKLGTTDKLMNMMTGYLFATSGSPVMYALGAKGADALQKKAAQSIVKNKLSTAAKGVQSPSQKAIEKVSKGIEKTKAERKLNKEAIKERAAKSKAKTTTVDKTKSLREQLIEASKTRNTQ